METPTDDAAAAAGAAPNAPATQTPLEKLTEAVDKNPLDFNSWVSLLTLVQSEVRAVQLHCFFISSAHVLLIASTTVRDAARDGGGHYALYEYGLANKTREDGTGMVATLEEAKAKAREVYERGVVAVKFSVDMWMKYCEFIIHKLHSPIDETRPYKYNQFVLAQQLSALATSEEQKALAGDGEELMDEGLLRVKIVNAVEAVKNKTMEDVYRRQAFEAGIDRSYFHVTPVTEASMKNWHSYLDFEEAAGNNVRCQTLYERCLISCANYEEIWLRYVAWNESVHGFEAAYAVFQRAVTIFLKYRASIYLEYAAFLEAHNKVQKAQETYMKVLSDVAPKLAEAFLHYCNFERRRGDVETAKTWYERGMETVENEVEVYAYIATSYAAFLHKTSGDAALARGVFECALQKHSDSVLLWLNFIHFEINVSRKDSEFVSRVARIYELALEDTCNLSMDEKNDLWFQYVEFVENYGDSIAQVRELRKKEMSWKPKNSQSRNRTIKVLNFQPGCNDDVGGYSSNVDPGMKRPRYTAPQTPVVTPTPAATVEAPTTVATAAIPATTATATAATTAAAYYQGYQAYGAQAYSQADPTAVAGQQVYSQAQYASYYQQ
ncbi:unnamed protein product [Phytophthora lilii]|uniref:Unnamed protein product n=1 Tax=Phytophthora lilii TaxID=2077276 RepID=A0A9W6X487_9STRA|nr:unnamed protein product [Phytophthora lilii]